jgi:hypothetical protein
MFDERSLLERNHDRVAWTSAYHTGLVPTAARIISEHDITGAETPYRSITGFDFDFASEGDDVLAPRGGMEVAIVSFKSAAKDGALSRLDSGECAVSPGFKVNLDLFEMRFIVAACVKSYDLHERVVGESLAKCKERSRLRREW